LNNAELSLSQCEQNHGKCDERAEAIGIIGLKAMGFSVVLFFLAVVMAEMAGLRDLPLGIGLFFVIHARVEGWF
jgi:hypothetical protein